MPYWWHSSGTPAAVGGAVHAVATPATVAAIAASPSAAEHGSVIAPLVAPTNLFIADLLQTSLTFSWDAPAGATKYDIERNGTIVVTNWLTTSYTDTGLSPNTSYRYRVHAKP